MNLLAKYLLGENVGHVTNRLCANMCLPKPHFYYL